MKKYCSNCKHGHNSIAKEPCKTCQGYLHKAPTPEWEPREEDTIVHDSQAPSEGRKDDNGKLRYDLIPPRSLEALVGVYTFGAAKYADRNWEQGISWCRVFAAIMRHSWAWFRGEDYDPESGIHHMAHAAFGCFALIEYTKTKPELDDRVKES